MATIKTPLEPKPDTNIRFHRTEDFARGYANNIYLETTGWDVKLIFGETDADIGNNDVVQHTAITIPWPQVKILQYLLKLNLLQHESVNGRIHIPPNVLHAMQDEMPKEFASIPDAAKFWEAVRKHYTEFITENPEAEPRKK